MSRTQGPVEPEELSKYIRRVRSLSGCIRIARKLEERDLNLTYGSKNIELLSTLISKLQQMSGDLLRTDLSPLPESRNLLRSYTFLLILRSGQYSLGAFNLSLGEKDAKEASEHALIISDYELYSLALNHLGNSLLSQQKITEGLKVLSLSAETDRREKNESGLTRSLYNLARGEIAVGEYAEAEKHIEEALQLYENSASLPQYGQAFLFGIRQTIYENSHLFGAALIDAHRSLALLEHLGLHQRIAEAHFNLVRLYLRLDNMAEAMYHTTKILPPGKETSANISERCYYFLSMGAIELRLNHNSKAKEYWQTGLALAENSGHTMFETMYLERLAEIARKQSLPLEAEKLLQRSLKKEGHRLKRMHIYEALARVALEQGNLDKAETFFREAVSQINWLPGKHQRRGLAIIESDILEAKGEVEQAATLLTAVANNTEVKLTMQADAHMRLHRIFQKEGVLEKALHHYQQYHRVEIERERLLGEHRMVSLRTAHEDQRAKIEWQEFQQQSEQKNRELEQASIKLAEYQQRMKKVESTIFQVIKLLSSSQPNIEKSKDELQGLVRTMRDAGKYSPHLLVHLRDNDREFFKRLGSQYPKLTSNQKRLCGLLRAGLTSSEITALLHISPETLATQRKRLRKKLGISRDVKLEQLLNSI